MARRSNKVGGSHVGKIDAFAKFPRFRDVVYPVARPVRSLPHVKPVARRSIIDRFGHAVDAPNRAIRKYERMAIKAVAPRMYEKFHNCKREWSRLLSWRSSVSGNSKKVRSQRELVNNKKAFKRRDC